VYGIGEASLYFELVPRGQTINAKKYWMLGWINLSSGEAARIDEEEVVFHHDNAKPHTALTN
jgi:hypothetical protein